MLRRSFQLWRGRAALAVHALVSLTGLLLSRGIYLSLPKPTHIEARLSMMPPGPWRLLQEVTIHWNAQQVPFIEAENDDDAAYALGLVHAHLRLGQMELARRIVYGRISELAGPAANAIDHTLRILDYPKSASAVVEAMPYPARRWVDRYVEGVNDYLAQTKRLPHEMRLLGMKKEPWTARDVMAIGRLAGTDYTWLIWHSLAPFRDSPEWETIWKTLLAAGSGHIYHPDNLRHRKAQEHNFRATATPESRQADLLLGIFNQFSKLGSNSLVVGPSRSRSGAPLIASDPHLGLNLPNLWLVAGLKCPTYNVVGMMAPGIPVFAFGRNHRIAWGGTNLHAAGSDLYDVSELKGSDLPWCEAKLKNRFWFPTKIRYRLSPYGPVITDAPLVFSATGRKVALKWVGHGMSDEITAMLDVNRAGGWIEFQQALKSFATPAQTMLYADVDGNIGRLTATHVPYRTEKFPEGMFADKGRYPDAWGRIVDASMLPTQFIPKEGFLVSANDPPPEGTVTVGYFFSPPDRANRLRKLVQNYERLDVEKLKRIQRDVFSASSLMLREKLLETMEHLGVKGGEAVQQMRDWDGHYRADSRGALAFQAFVSCFARALYRELGAKDELRAHEMLAYFEDFLMAKMDATDAETLRRVYPEALARADRLLQRYPAWGDIHRLRVKHVLAAIPAYGRRYVFRDLPASGSKETVMKSAHGVLGEKPQGAFFGAQSRHISDLADPNANYFVLLGGQDGWLHSSTFMDQAEMWEKGEYMRVPLEIEEVRASFPYKTRLMPVRKS